MSNVGVLVIFEVSYSLLDKHGNRIHITGEHSIATVETNERVAIVAAAKMLNNDVKVLSVRTSLDAE